VLRWEGGNAAGEPSRSGASPSLQPVTALAWGRQEVGLGRKRRASRSVRGVLLLPSPFSGCPASVERTAGFDGAVNGSDIFRRRAIAHSPFGTRTFW
jgi:hypothetical protein